jgi:exonuclease VII small subunit
MENFDKKLDNLMTQLETLQLGDTIKLPFSKKIELYQKAFPLIEEANQLLEKLQTEIRWHTTKLLKRLNEEKLQLLHLIEITWGLQVST